jgi:hypothetical protein
MRPKHASSANMVRKLQPRLVATRPGLLHSIWKAFFKSALSRDVAIGTKRARHQLASAMPGQETIDCAVAGRMPDRLFIGRLEVVDVRQIARPSGLGKLWQQRLLFRKSHVLALAATCRVSAIPCWIKVLFQVLETLRKYQLATDVHRRCAVAFAYHSVGMNLGLTIFQGNVANQRTQFDLFGLPG